MASPTSTHRARSRCRTLCGALLALAAAVMVITGQPTPVLAQQGMLSFPARPKPPPRPQRTQDQMLVRAEEINYDYTNERVLAVGNVQIYYGGSTLEANRVIYDQKTKRLHAAGNVQLTHPDGTVSRGEIMDLSDDYRDGFVDSLRVDAPEQTRFAATRAERSAGNFTVFHNGVYTACEPCKEDPRKPPKWQVKAARMIHDQGEKMIYFENASLDFLGVPFVYIPYFSAPDPTVKRKSGFLVPSYGSSNVYGLSVSVPYFWALAPNYDLTLTPMITTKQGPLLQGEWRHRLVTGAYIIRASGLFQLDKEIFRQDGIGTPGYLDWRGSVETTGQFNLSEKWVWGWDGTLLSDKTYLQDYGLNKFVQTSNLLRQTPDSALSQLYIAGRGDRSYFDARTLYFFGFSPSDDQKQIPIIHPVVDSDYTLKDPLFGGELAVRSNATSLSRDTADFNPISPVAVTQGLCNPSTADPAVKNSSNCLLRGVPGNYTRVSSEATWKRTLIDSWGQMFTPFIAMRADAAAVDVTDQTGVSNYINVGQADIGRVMPTAGFEYRYPLISVQSWGTQMIEPIAQLVFRPNETGVGLFPNEDAQSLIYDDFEPVQGEQVLRLGPRRGGQPRQCRRSIYRPVQSRRLRQFPVRPVLPAARAELVCARRHHQYRSRQWPRYRAFRLRDARIISAELYADLHVALPSRRVRLHLASHRAGGHRQLRPLDHHAHVRQLRGPTCARISRGPRRRSRHGAAEGDSELGLAWCSAI